MGPPGALPVIVALDATPLTIGTGGLSRYTQQLVTALAARYPDDQYWLAADRDFPCPHGVRRAPKPQNMAERRWWLYGLRKSMERCGAQVFHGTDFSVPYSRRVASVMTIHDLSPWLNADWQPDAGRVRRRTPQLLRMGIPAMVITPTEAIRRAAIKRFRLSPENTVAIPHAASPLFRPTPAPADPYFLFVGTLEPRKNIARMIEAWRATYAEFHIPFKIVGRTRADYAAPQPELGLELLGELPDLALPALYTNATAVIYPSLYEGFGLPVLEAMQCGALVITSTDPAIQEVANEAALLVEADDTSLLAKALRLAAQRPVEFQPLRQKAIARAAQFSWRKTAEQTREIYQQALKMRGGR